MKIRAGFNISYETQAPTALMLMLKLRPEREADLLTPQVMTNDRGAPMVDHIDGFGNIRTRVLLPEGLTTFSADFLMQDSGDHDPVMPHLEQHPVSELPDETLTFLLPSRYCEVDLLNDTAWELFGRTEPGWGRVAAIVKYAHERITFGYPNAKSTRTAYMGHQEQVGVCRDYAHLAVTLCRAMNIPARYVTGYLGDIGIDPVPGPMDFSAWFEVYLGGAWRTFDARHNKPRIGRKLQAVGRDATDVAISTAFGSAILRQFDVICEEVR